MKPHSTEYPSFFSRYVDLVSETDPISVLQQKNAGLLLRSLSEQQGRYRYAEGKWSIKEVLGHVVDAERIFAYRALSIARGEKQSLPGFDENAYVENARFESRTFESVLAEYAAVREATILLFQSFDETILSQTGVSNNNPASVRALVYITAGHEQHHVNILNERYLN